MNATAAVHRKNSIDLDAAIGRGLLRQSARANDELALLMRLELMAFLRGAKVVHWAENQARDRVFWFEHRLAGMKTGCLEGVVLPRRDADFTAADLAAMTDERLFEPRIQLASLGVLRPISHGEGGETTVRHGRMAVSARTSQYHDILALARTYEEALASFGKHTRRNMRNTRKQAIGRGLHYAGLSADQAPDEAELLALAKRNFPYVTPPRRLRKFQAYMRTTGRPFHSCVRAADGSLVSYCSAFLDHGRAYIAYQLNDVRLRDLGISLLHRGYLIEALISAGIGELVFISGCSGTLQHSCQPVTVENTWVMHPSLSALARTAAISIALRNDGGIGKSARAAFGAHVQGAW